MDTLKLALVFDVTSEARLRAYAASFREELAAGRIEEAVAEVVHNPVKASLDTGYELLKIDAVATDAPDRFIVRLEADVFDCDALIAEALVRYRECWQDEDWYPETLGEALYEVAYASNASPSPSDIGLQTMEAVWQPDIALARPAEAVPGL